MHDPSAPDPPAPVAILSLGTILIASLRTAPDDTELLLVRRDLLEAIGRHRAQRVVLDVSEVDVMDSYTTRTIRDIAAAARLRGAPAVVVGVPPDVAVTMVRLGMDTGAIDAALDLDHALEALTT